MTEELDHTFRGGGAMLLESRRTRDVVRLDYRKAIWPESDVRKV